MAAQPQALSAADRLRLSAGTSFHPANTQHGCWLEHGGRTVQLNESAGEILRRCNGETSIKTLIDDLSTHYEGSSATEIGAAVTDFLHHALHKGWVDLSADLG